MRLIFIFLFIPFLSFSQLKKPYQLDWKKDLTISTGLLLTTSLSYYLSTQATGLNKAEIAKLNINQLNTLDQIAVNNFNLKHVATSEYLMYASLALPTLVLLDKNAQKDIFTLGVIGAEGLLLAYNLRTLNKVLINRPKPFMYRPDVPLEKKMEPESRHSFISGHATYSFFGAALLSSYYSDYYPSGNSKYWVTAGAYSLASLSAAYRTASGVHFITDVLAGAVVGASTAYLMVYLHKAPKEKLSFYTTGNGVALQWHF